MGIDIYARYRGQPQEELDEQSSYYMTGAGGGVGYLREAYHGQPYVTRFLVGEAFATGEAAIRAALLRERLPEARRLAEVRLRQVYQETDDREIRSTQDNYTAFVEFCERIERETGEPALIIAWY